MITINPLSKKSGAVQAEEREPAKLYIESDLPLILTMAKDGSYASAMKSADEMKQLVEHLSWEFDRAANMDW